jgi:prepilin-type N-terminal cleavage/methylation domain-containing protein
MKAQKTIAAENTTQGGPAASGLLRTSSGFTLVEVLVSALLVTICLSAVAVVTRVGSQLQVSDNNHRQARGILRSVFEDEYNYRQYASIPDSSSQAGIVNIDPRDGNVLQGALTRTSVSDSVLSANGTMVPVKIITLTLKWDEGGAGQQADTQMVTMYKILAAIQ